MWARWQNRQQAHQQPVISQPTSFTPLDQEGAYAGYGYDEKYLETIPEVDSISSRRQSAQVGLPELPFRAVPPMTVVPQPVTGRGGPSPTTPTQMSANSELRIDTTAQHQPASDEVSPVTPRASQERRQQREDDQPVSPIEPAGAPKASAPLPERNFQSQIPRKVLQSTTEDKPRTKWDEYSGEPTGDDRGKESSVRPGAQPVEIQYPHLKERTKEILAGLREREVVRKIPVPKQVPSVSTDPLDNPPQREPWRGASGRSAIVEPVKNTPSARKKAPQPARQHISHMDASHPPDAKAGPPSQLTSPSQPESSPPRESPATIRMVPVDEAIKPVVPLKTRHLTPDFSSNSPFKGSPTNSPVPRLAPAAEIKEASHARVESPPYDPEPTTPTTPTAAADPHVEEFTEPSRPFAQPDMDQEQSRFSWTTYATSTVESPRSIAQVGREWSPPPPMPALTQPRLVIIKRPVTSSPSPSAQPYMQQSFSESTSSVVRKPVPGSNARSASHGGASRAVSTSKLLPPTPTITEAADKIENLDAQLESLNRRKHNIVRIVANLEASLKKNAVVYDMWKRREVEKNITNQKLELDEISQEIHEIGLQLHRAQRKRDREGGYEACTGLWIKRVTG